MKKPRLKRATQRKLISVLAAAFLMQISAGNFAAHAWSYAPQVNKLLTDATDLYNRGQYSSAKMQFNAALALEPNCPDAYNGLGLCSLKEGNIDMSSSCYESALKLRPNFYNSLYNLANNMYLQQRYSEAIAYYQRALKANDSGGSKLDPELLSSLASVYRDRASSPSSTSRAADLQRAHQFYEKAIEIKPDLPQAHAMLGRLYLDEKNFPKAEKELRDAISYKENYSYAYYVLGRLYLQKKEYPAALVAYHNSLKYETVGKYKEETSREMSQMGIPSDVSDHFARGYELMNSADWSGAESEFEAVAGQNTSFKAVALNNLGYLQTRQKKWADAINSYRAAIEASPHGQPEFYYNLGQAHLTKFSETKLAGQKSAPSPQAAKADQDLQQAGKALTQCLAEARGNHFLAHNALGIVHKLQGDLPKALSEYNLALLQSGGHLAVVQYNRGLVLESLGRKDEAKKSFQGYLQFAPSGINAENAKQKVAHL